MQGRTHNHAMRPIAQTTRSGLTGSALEAPPFAGRAHTHVAEAGGARRKSIREPHSFPLSHQLRLLSSPNDCESVQFFRMRWTAIAASLTTMTDTNENTPIVIPAITLSISICASCCCDLCRSPAFPFRVVPPNPKMGNWILFPGVAQHTVFASRIDSRAADRQDV